MLALTASYLSVLFGVTNVVGGRWRLGLVAVCAFAAAVLLARFLTHRQALAMGTVLLLVGTGHYFASSPQGVGAVASIGRLLSDVVALATGFSILGIVAADSWAISFAPAPIFLSWYLVLRERYVSGAAVGGAALSVFVLTGDAGVLTTLVGAVGAAGTLGFGELSKHGATIGDSDVLAIVLALMVVTTLSVTVVPGGATQPVLPDRGTSQTVEGSLLGGQEQVTIVGSVDLSPEVRFTIQSEEAGNWRVESYDRHTGEGWVRSGDLGEFQTDRAPPGNAREVEMTVRAERETRAMPAHWLATRVTSDVAVQQSREDGLHPVTPLQDGDSYTVVSARPNATDADLAGAGADYPDQIQSRYTQLPDNMPDRVGERTAELVADADSPYEAATIVERYLEDTKEYSLDVDRPDGDVADAFLFEMEAGYCTYFATTMVAMLRSQDIPARFVTGYSTGERIDEDRWVVRGSNAHAWVEVYIPEVGWVEFDPTPAGPYDDARAEVLEEARDAGEEGVDTDESGGEEWTPEPTDEDVETPGESLNQTDVGNASDRPDDAFLQDETLCEADWAVQEGHMTEEEWTAHCADVWMSGEQSIPDTASDARSSADQDAPPPEPDRQLPAPERLGVGFALLVGVVAGAHRTGLTGRARYEFALRWQGPRQSPPDTVEHAYDRLELLLERRYRPRQPGESVRAYLQALERVGLDEQLSAVGFLYERARYGPGVSDEEAARAVELVDDEVGRFTAIARRFGR